jgi:hypothetical protein
MKSKIGLMGFLEHQEQQYSVESDAHESITPTTNKGYLTPESRDGFFQAVIAKLDKLKEANQEHNFYKTIEGNFQSQEQVGDFLARREQAISKLVANETFIKKYQYKTSESSQVLRFGITSHDESLIQQISTVYNPAIKKEETIQVSDAISVFSKSTKDKAADVLSKDNRFQELKVKAQKQITLTEQSVITQAIDYLNDTDRKTVLVDLFARHTKDGEYKTGHEHVGQQFASGHIKYTADGALETHTVVLYKQNDRYLVIDPSNAEFSAILVGAHDDIRVCFSKKFQVYQAIENAEENYLLGPKPDQWRDCIDISVKLAFSLNRNPQSIELESFNKSEIIKTDSLKGNISIEEISNNIEMYKIFPGELREYPLRAKQSSNIVEGKLYNAMLKYLFNVYKVLEIKIKEYGFFYIISKFDSIRQEYFLQKYRPEEYKIAIQNFHNMFDEIKYTTDVGEIKLLAEETKTIISIFDEV